MTQPDGTRWAVVLSSDAIGLGAVRSLHAAGVPTMVVLTRGWEPARFSRHAVKRSVKPPRDGEQALLDLLHGIARRPRPVLIPTSDSFADFIARHRRQLATRFRWAIPPRDLTQRCLDKAALAHHVSACGIPTPLTLPELPSSPSQLVRLLRLPLIVKPRTYADRERLGWRNVILRSREHAERLYRRHGGLLDRVVAQELIPGGDDALWECIGVFDNHGRLARAFTFRKLRTLPAHFGQTTYGRSERNEVILDLSCRLGRTLGYAGPADIDLKYDERDGTYKVLELNPRLGMCHHFATRCGVNLAEAAYRVACGEDVPAIAPQREGRTFLATLEDLGARVRAGDSAFAMLRDLAVAIGRQSVGAYFEWADPLPGPMAAGRLVYRFLQMAAAGGLASSFSEDYGTKRAARRALAVPSEVRSS